MVPGWNSNHPNWVVLAVLTVGFVLEVIVAKLLKSKNSYADVRYWLSTFNIEPKSGRRITVTTIVQM